MNKIWRYFTNGKQKECIEKTKEMHEEIKKELEELREARKSAQTQRLAAAKYLASISFL